jgi:drug/metabolite transporter (DMT)-like permease
MKCFYHPEADAVGTCKHCSRGLCRACAAERDGGLACSGRHEAEVDAVSALIRRNVQVGVKSRPLSLVAFGVFVTALIILIYLAVKEENPNVRIMLYMLAAFSFVAVLGQVPVIRTMFARKKGP